MWWRPLKREESKKQSKRSGRRTTTTMGGLLKFLPIFLLSILSSSPSSHGWGKEGHIIVCKIAKDYFTEKTTKAVLDLLPESAKGELSTVCPWADTVRFKYHWSSQLHYVTTPGVCSYKFSRDCYDSKGEKDRCVVGAINNYTEQLREGYGNPSNGYNLTESLMFLAHFVGDVHQPLHAGFEEDEGGNTIIIRWYRRKTNLHHLWDTDMIETAMKDFYNKDLDTMVEGIQMNITDDWSDQIHSWENCENKYKTCANEYAGESTTLACKYAYKDVEQNITLGDDYFFSRLPVVEKRLAQAGVRLGLMLNRIFDAPPKETIQSY